MSFIERFRGLLSSRIETFEIKLTIQRQDDGYIFISSPELKAFTLMLSPETTKNSSTLFAAIHDPLILYMEAYCRAKATKEAKALRQQSRHLEIKKWGEIAPNSYAVQLSPC